MLTLFDILHEIEKTKQNGKTAALAQAADDIRGILLVSTFEQAKKLKPLYPNAIIMTPHSLEQIRQYNKPIFIDHYLLFILAKNLVKEKDEKISELQDEMIEKAFEMQRRISELERKEVDYQSTHYNDIARLQQAYDRIARLREENDQLKKSLGQSLLSKLFRRK